MANRNLRCFICDVRGQPRVMKKLDGNENENKRQVAVRFRQDLRMPFEEIRNESRLCATCFRLVVSEIEMEDDRTCVRLNVLKQSDGRSCLICNAYDNVHKLTAAARAKVFLKINVFIPDTVRCCLHHLTENGFILDALFRGLRYLNRVYRLTGEQLQSFLSNLRDVSISNEAQLVCQDKLSDDDFKLFTSLTKQQFREMLDYCDPVPIQDGNRYVREKDLLVFL